MEKKDKDLLEHLIITWRKKADQSEKNFEGTKLELYQHRFRAKEQVYNECADDLTGLIQSIDNVEKLIT